MSFFSVKEIVQRQDFDEALLNFVKVANLYAKGRIPTSVQAGLFKTIALKILRIIYNVPSNGDLILKLLKEYVFKSSIPDESRDEGIAPLKELEKQTKEKSN